MTRRLEWYKEESEHNRRIYELLHGVRPRGAHDWKVNALFYSALHRVNYWLVKLGGPDPKNHTERNDRVRRELAHMFGDYRDLYMMSIGPDTATGLELKITPVSSP